MFFSVVCTLYNPVSMWQKLQHSAYISTEQRTTLQSHWRTVLWFVDKSAEGWNFHNIIIWWYNRKKSDVLSFNPWITIDSIYNWPCFQESQKWAFYQACLLFMYIFSKLEFINLSSQNTSLAQPRRVNSWSNHET